MGPRRRRRKESVTAESTPSLYQRFVGRWELILGGAWLAVISSAAGFMSLNKPVDFVLARIGFLAAWLPLLIAGLRRLFKQPHTAGRKLFAIGLLAATAAGSFVAMKYVDAHEPQPVHWTLFPQIDGVGSGDPDGKGFITDGNVVINTAGWNIRTYRFDLGGPPMTQMAVEVDGFGDADVHNLHAEIKVAAKYLKFATEAPSERRADFNTFTIEKPLLVRSRPADSVGHPNPTRLIDMYFVPPPNEQERIKIILKYAAEGIEWVTAVWWVSYRRANNLNTITLEPGEN